MTAPPRSGYSSVVAALGTPEPEPTPPEYDENGVDLGLVRYSLSLTPTQRLKAVENFMNAMASVRAAPSLAIAAENAQ